MPEPIRLALGTCVIEIWPAVRYLQTVFPDGTKVPAAPNFDPASIQRAHDLGYGGDTWAMSRDHEILHTLLATWLGHEHSPTLWHVAHSVKPPKGLILTEECLVLAFQKYLNTGFVSSELDRLTPTGKSLEQLADEARAVLARSIDEALANG